MKLTRYEKYDTAFETIGKCIVEYDYSKVAEAKKALAKINDLVEKECPVEVEYNHVARNYQGELEYDEPYCPECGNELGDNEEFDYCPFCGQRISWGI